MSTYSSNGMDHEKYALMGVSPRELYLRQTKKCWLEGIYDSCEEDGKEQIKLYCTDGKEYAETNGMLNPTFECIQCLTKYILKINVENGRH